MWAPGDVLVFDWGEIGPLFVFCAVLAWSRWRFVSFADNLGASSTMAALAQCMETIGGVPKTLLTDRMGCLKAGTVAGVVIPTPAYVRFVTHYGTRPDFCEGADPASKAWATDYTSWWVDGEDVVCSAGDPRWRGGRTHPVARRRAA